MQKRWVQKRSIQIRLFVFDNNMKKTIPGDISLSTDLCKENTGVIVLNRMYSGDYLVDNIGHEVINLYKADNGKFYLYLNALGSFDFKWTDKIKTMIMVRTIKGAKMLEVLGLATELKDVFKYGTKKQTTFIRENNVSYAGKTLDDIFKGNTMQQDICISFEAKKVVLPKKRILVAFNDSKQDIIDQGNDIVVNLSGINQAKASLKQYIEETDTDAYNTLKRLINNPSLWGEEVCKVQDSLIEVHKDTYFDICGIGESELAYSNAIAYFFEKYPHLFSGFMKTKGVNFNISGKFRVLRESRNIDLLFTNGSVSVVIENKITSGINGIDKHDPTKSQLEKYYHILLGGGKYNTKDDKEYRKQFPNPVFFVLRPNYNNVDITQYNCHEYYSEILYSDLYSFLLNCDEYNTDYLFAGFVDALKPHTKEYNNDLYELMKKRFLQKIKDNI